MHARWQGRWALVTGATRGIGLALARRLAEQGLGTVVVARDESRLAEIAGELSSRYDVPAVTYAGDLATPRAAGELAGWLRRRRLDVEVLVNNAGFGTYGRFAELPPDAEREQIQLNVVALVELTRELLPAMLARGSGGVLNVASTASFMPGPMMATYNAGKAFVLHFSEALAEEVAGTGVRVTAVCPGYTRTGFQARAGMDDLAWIRTQEAMSPDAVATVALAALQRGRPVVVPGARNRLLTLLPRWLPRRWVASLTGRVLGSAA